MFGRDQTRNAVSPEKNPPASWMVEVNPQGAPLPGRGKNVKWIARLGNLSFSAPVVANGYVWIGTNSKIMLLVHGDTYLESVRSYIGTSIGMPSLGSRGISIHRCRHQKLASFCLSTHNEPNPAIRVFGIQATVDQCYIKIDHSNMRSLLQ